MTLARPPLDYDLAFKAACLDTFGCDLLEIEAEEMRMFACFGWLILRAERLECRPPTLVEAQEFAVRILREY